VCLLSPQQDEDENNVTSLSSCVFVKLTTAFSAIEYKVMKRIRKEGAFSCAFPTHQDSLHEHGHYCHHRIIGIIIITIILQYWFPSNDATHNIEYSVVINAILEARSHKCFKETQDNHMMMWRGFAAPWYIR
jgi:hypothetical protein